MSADVVLGLSGGLTTLGVLFELLRRKRLREKYAAFWIIVAVATIAIAAYPPVLYAAADLTGVQVPSNLLFFLAIIALMVVSMQHSHELGRMEERTRNLVEEVALLRMRVDSGPGGSDPNADSRPSEPDEWETADTLVR